MGDVRTRLGRSPVACLVSTDRAPGRAHHCAGARPTKTSPPRCGYVTRRLVAGSMGSGFVLVQTNPMMRCSGLYRTHLNFPGNFAFTTSATLQDDGKILVAGASYSPIEAGAH